MSKPIPYGYKWIDNIDSNNLAHNISQYIENGAGLVFGI